MAAPESNVSKIKSPGGGRGYIRIACADRDEV
jgi:hypothetical protein